MRHLHKRTLWLQDRVAEKTIELGRVPSENKEVALGTMYLEKDKIKKCVAKTGMLFAGAWAGEQAPVVTGIQEIDEGDPILGENWLMMGVVLLAAVGGVQLLPWAWVALVSPATNWKSDWRARASSATGLHDHE